MYLVDCCLDALCETAPYKTFLIPLSPMGLSLEMNIVVIIAKQYDILTVFRLRTRMSFDLCEFPYQSYLHVSDILQQTADQLWSNRIYISCINLNVQSFCNELYLWHWLITTEVALFYFLVFSVVETCNGYSLADLKRCPYKDVLNSYSIIA